MLCGCAVVRVALNCGCFRFWATTMSTPRIENSSNSQNDVSRPSQHSTNNSTSYNNQSHTFLFGTQPPVLRSNNQFVTGVTKWFGAIVRIASNCCCFRILVPTMADPQIENNNNPYATYHMTQCFAAKRFNDRLTRQARGHVPWL